MARLRAQGRYEAALTAARVIADNLPENIPAYKRDGSRQLVETLRYVTTLEPALQDKLAEADALALAVDSLTLEEDAIALFGTAVRCLRLRYEVLGKQHPETIAALQVFEKVCISTGERVIAGEANKNALALTRETFGANDPHYAAALLAAARIGRAVDGRREEQLALHEEALAILKPYESFERPLVADVLSDMGHWYRSRDNGVAPAKLAHALAIREQSATFPSFATASSRCWLGWTLLHLGRHAEAQRHLEAAEAEVRACGLTRHSIYGVILNAQADLAAVRGHFEKAESLYTIGNRTLEEARDRFLPGFGYTNPLQGYDDLAAVQVINGKNEAAWRSLQKHRNDLNTDFLHFSRWKDEDPDGFAAVSRIRHQLTEHDTRSQHRPLGDWDGWLEGLTLRAELYQLEQDYLRRRRAQTVTLDRLQAQLDPSTAVIGLLLTRTADRMYASQGRFTVAARLYVVRDRGPIRWVTLWEVHDRDDAERYLGSYAPYGQCGHILRSTFRIPLRIPRDPELDYWADRFRRQWFDSALPLLDGVETLIVEQSGIFPWVPIASMPAPGGGQLADRFPIAYVPSAASFVLLREASRRPPTPEPVALAVGGAVYARDGGTPLSSTVVGGSQLRSAIDGDPKALDRLPALPYSENEVLDISRVLPRSLVMLGEDASEPALSDMAKADALVKFDILHFAVHTLMDVNPGRCSLALSRTGVDGTPGNDGLIRAEDVLLNWRLDADLVVLSGCQSGLGGQPDDGGRYLGFPQVLMGVGARSIIVTLWKVDDEATALLMDRFYENLAGRYGDDRGSGRGVAMSKVHALGEAKRWIRDYTNQDGERIFEHPIYWSGFLLMGLPD